MQDMDILLFLNIYFCFSVCYANVAIKYHIVITVYTEKLFQFAEYHPKTCYFSITNLYMVWLWNISPGANAVEGNCGLFGLS